MRYTLVSDGSSDQALMPILEWALREAGVTADLQSQWADLRTLRKPPTTLQERIRTAIDLYPCDLLFVHRDSEGQRLQLRTDEITHAIEALKRSGIEIPHVCVVPIRMQEAWLLISEQAIRTAAGNPRGKIELHLPRPRDLEDLHDPKQSLFGFIQVASEFRGRRLQRLSVVAARRRISELTDDFSPLRELSAFQSFENELRAVTARAAATWR